MTQIEANDSIPQQLPPRGGSPAVSALPWSYSLGDVSRFLKACIIAERINASIDERALKQIAARYRSEGYGSYKYFDKRQWLRAKAMRAVELRLERSNRRRVLDLGCGPRYFLYVCRWLGHDVHGLDLDATGFYNAIIELLDLRRTTFRIEPNRPLPTLEQRFDVISAHQICFNGHKSAELWGAREWDFFLDDLKANHLAPGGVIALEFNPEPGVGFYSDAVAQVFAAHRARIVRGRVFIGDDGGSVRR